MRVERKELIKSTKGAKTLAGLVYEQIRDDIIHCRIPASTKLQLDELSQRYGVGGGAVREALSRLSSTGLVLSEGQRGFFVAGLDVGQLLDLTKNRTWVEVLAIRSSIAKGGIGWESEIVAAEHRLGPVQPRLQMEDKSLREEDWYTVHRNFHFALIAACGSELLISQWHSLQDSFNRYRRDPNAVKPNRDVAGQHSEIVQAVINRKAQAAARLMAAHILETTETILGQFAPSDVERHMAELRADLRTGMSDVDFG